MRDDISDVLFDWPYDGEEGPQARRIDGEDGEPRIQLRVDLGVLQMTLTGRPDGVRPFECETLLDYYSRQALDHRRCHGWYEGFELDSHDCAALRREAVQFYHRRVACMSLGEWAQAAADAEHNLAILDLIRAFAAEPADAMAMERYRPYIACHRTQALVQQHMGREDLQAALLEVEEGIQELRAIFKAQDRPEYFEDSQELAALAELKEMLEPRCQVARRQRLHILLDDALRREDPDTAANLRAQLREFELGG